MEEGLLGRSIKTQFQTNEEVRIIITIENS